MQIFLISQKLLWLSLPCLTGQVTAVPSAVTPDTESELSDLSEELDLLDEERGVLPQHHTPLPSENLTASRAEDAQRDQQQLHLFQTLPEALATTQDPLEGPRTSLELVHASQKTPAAEEGTQKSNDIPSLRPPPADICLMVEDPYFDTPMSSPSSEEAPMDSTQDAKEWLVSPIFSTPSLCVNDHSLELNSPASGKWSYVCIDRVEKSIPEIFLLTEVHFVGEVNTDEEVPPPLPQRTPESYVLAVDEGWCSQRRVWNVKLACPGLQRIFILHNLLWCYRPERSDPCETVIIPPNAAAEAVRELGGERNKWKIPETLQYLLEHAQWCFSLLPPVWKGLIWPVFQCTLMSSWDAV